MTGDPLGAFDFEGWTTGMAQEAGMWWQLELPAAENVAEIHFYSPNGAGGAVEVARGPWRGRQRGARAPPPAPQTTAPRGYRVQLSMDGATWSAPVAEGAADGNMTAISWTPTQARFIDITQTATHAWRAGLVDARDQALRSGAVTRPVRRAATPASSSAGARAPRPFRAPPR